MARTARLLSIEAEAATKQQQIKHKHKSSPRRLRKHTHVRIPAHVDAFSNHHDRHGHNYGNSIHRHRTNSDSDVNNPDDVDMYDIELNSSNPDGNQREYEGEWKEYRVDDALPAHSNSNVASGKLLSTPQKTTNTPNTVSASSPATTSVVWEDIKEEDESLPEEMIVDTKATTYIDQVWNGCKAQMITFLRVHGFVGVIVMAMVPNFAFDLCGICCGSVYL